jgi:hypothetical protein
MSEHSEDLAVVIDDFGVALNWSELHDRRSSHSSTNRATAGWPPLVSALASWGADTVRRLAGSCGRAFVTSSITRSPFFQWLARGRNAARARCS